MKIHLSQSNYKDNHITKLYDLLVELNYREVRMAEVDYCLCNAIEKLVKKGFCKCNVKRLWTTPEGAIWINTFLVLLEDEDEIYKFWCCID